MGPPYGKIFLDLRSSLIFYWYMMKDAKPLQVGITVWCIALVTMEVAFPHTAVMTGILARLLQAGIFVVGFLMLYILSDRSASSNRYSVGLPKSVIDFTMIPRESTQKFR